MKGCSGYSPASNGHGICNIVFKNILWLELAWFLSCLVVQISYRTKVAFETVHKDAYCIMQCFPFKLQSGSLQFATENLLYMFRKWSSNEMGNRTIIAPACTSPGSLGPQDLPSPMLQPAARSGSKFEYMVDFFMTKENQLNKEFLENWAP